MCGEVQTFHVLPIDHEILGLEWRSWEDNVYFCTPKGAEILGGPDLDGIHFVVLPKDKRVFCVSPVGDPKKYVLPVAASLLSFFSYLLFCKDSLPIAKIHELSEKKYRGLLAEDAALTWPGSEVYYEKKRRSLRTIAAAYGVRPEDPYAPVKALQGSFHQEELEFTEHYYQVLAAVKEEEGVFLP